jgi:hypothetical protein
MNVSRIEVLCDYIHLLIKRQVRIFSLFWQVCGTTAILLGVTFLNNTRAQDFGTILIQRFDPAPGTVGAQFNGFSPPLINRSGRFSVRASLRFEVGDYSAQTAQGIWSNGSDDLELVMRLGFPAPGTPAGVNFGSFISGTNGHSIKFNDVGQTVFNNVRLSGTGVTTANDNGIWRDQTLVAREDDQAPGFPAGVRIGTNTSLDGLRWVALNDNGSVLFDSKLEPCTEAGGCGINFQNDSVLWIWNGPGTLEKVLQAGEEPPGIPDGAYGGFAVPRLNDNDQVALNIVLQTGSVNGGVTCHDNDGLLSDASGSWALIAREGDHAPGTAAGTDFGDGQCGTWGTFGTLAFTNAGKIAAAAHLTGTGVTADDDTGIWTNVNSSMELVAREGTQAPGAPAGAVFDDFFSATFAFQPHLNENGQVLLHEATLKQGTGGVDSTNRSGIWMGSPGSLALVARMGSQVPDFPAGVSYFDFESACGFSDTGAFAFKARIAGPGIDLTNSRVLFIYDPDAAVVKTVFQEGDQVESSPGVFATIAQLFCGNFDSREISPGGNGHQVFLNESAQFGYTLTSYAPTSDAFLVMSPGLNEAPLADAGADQSVHPGSVVNLDGSGSSDPDGDLPLEYSWQFDAVPLGSNATLSDPGIVNPTFVPDLIGDYDVSLVVSDAKGRESAADPVLISTFNTAPTADAGPDQVLTALFDPVQLDGTQSFDLDGDDITFDWSLSVPAGSAATLDDESSDTPSLTPDVQGDYVAELVVTDVFLAASDPDAVTLSFENLQPVADAGGNQSVNLGDTVMLDGTGSSDANNDPLTFSWAFVSKPAGSTADFSDASAAITDFVADLGGSYVVGLTVNDGMLDSDPNNVTILAVTSAGAVVTALQDLIDAINLVPPGDLKNANMAGTLTNKVNAVLELVDQYEFAEARDKLVNDLLAKTDGCNASGAPDKNDWITSCDEQAVIYGMITDAIALLDSV